MQQLHTIRQVKHPGNRGVVCAWTCLHCWIDAQAFSGGGPLVQLALLCHQLFCGYNGACRQLPSACNTHPAWEDDVWLVGVNLSWINGAQHGAFCNHCEDPTGSVLAVVRAVVRVRNTQAKGRPQLWTLAPSVAVVVGVVGARHVSWLWDVVWARQGQDSSVQHCVLGPHLSHSRRDIKGCEAEAQQHQHAT